MVDKKLSDFDEVSVGSINYFPVLDDDTKNAKIKATKVLPFTNCITELSQDINLTLSSGTLTLKAGSKVYVPNGSGVFNAVTIASDITFTQSSNAGTNYIFVNNDGTSLTRHPNMASGVSIPSGFTGEFYNTSTNQIYYCSNGSGTAVSSFSFPIAKVTISTNNTATVSSIDQIFNGLGYIGSTIFALPGIKGLIPNGRNSDGTLKNESFSITTVKTYTYTSTDSTSKTIVYTGSNLNLYTYSVYDPIDNCNENSVGSNQIVCHFGNAVINSGKIASFNPKVSFVATDYFDFKQADLENAKKDKSQTFTGSNTFSGNNSFTGSNTFSDATRVKSSTADSTVAPASTIYQGMTQNRDKNNVQAGYVQTQYNTDGTMEAQLGLHRVVSGADKYATIRVRMNTSGETETFIRNLRIDKLDNNLSGGQLSFEGADNEPNVGRYLSLTRYNGSLFFAGYNSYGTYYTPLKVDMQNNAVTAHNPSVAARDDTVFGGQITFNSAAGEVNTGKGIYINRNNGTLRVSGFSSNNTGYTPLQIDIQNDKVIFDANSQANLNKQMMPNYSAGVSVAMSGTATSNGYIYISASTSSNITVFIESTAYTILKGDSFMWPVQKGTSYSITGGNHNAVFYPCIGG